MEIIVLGPGCAKCKKLEQKTIKTVNELGIDATITKEDDIYKIMQFGVMQTPGLVINGKVVMSGSLPSSKELTELITKNQ